MRKFVSALLFAWLNARISSVVLFLLMLMLPIGCLSVSADHGTLITEPTQLTTAQVGDYLVRSGSLYGFPAPTGQGIHVTGNITVVGPALLQDLVVDGCIKIDKANRVELERVWVEHCSGDGIELVSDEGKEQSCCAKLDKVMSINNSGSGAHFIHTADVFIALSEFENNGRYGLELSDSPTERIVNSDFGGNTMGGLFADRTSHLTMLSNNQYGNNIGPDITLQSQNNIINSQEFIGPTPGCALIFVGVQRIGTNNFGPRQICQ